MKNLVPTRYPWACILMVMTTVVLLGCTEPAPDPLLVDLDDHVDALTDAPGDALFTIEVFEADGAYPVDALVIEIIPYGDTGASALAGSVELFVDQNGDGMLGVGDTLVIREGPTDRYNQSHSGTLFDVTVDVREGDGMRRLAERQWVGDGGLG